MRYRHGEFSRTPPKVNLRLFCPSCFLACAIGLAVILIAYFLAYPLIQARGSARQLETGKALYTKHCASCHGVNLEGEPNWQTRKIDGKLPAPPHDETGHTWHHSDDQIFRITKLGIFAVVPDYESDMIGFANKLSDDEIRAIIAFIKSTWPQKHRQYQEQRNQVE
jgi:mono/diheme cytochrome c family protein